MDVTVAKLWLHDQHLIDRPMISIEPGGALGLEASYVLIEESAFVRLVERLQMRLLPCLPCPELHKLLLRGERCPRCDHEKGGR